MTTHVTATCAALGVAWSVQQTAQHGLDIHLRFEGFASQGVYVLDRLWRNVSKPEIDGNRIYRFERDGSLRLLLGAAPCRRPVHNRNVPHATLIGHRAIHERAIHIPAPIAEYNPYFADATPQNSRCARVRRVILMVEYVIVDRNTEVTPAPEDPTAIRLLKHEDRALLISEMPTTEFDVLRHVDRFDRLVLPGELPEPLDP
jgi:hypothetical protein